MVQIFGLDTDNALDSEGIGWSGIVRFPWLTRLKHAD